MKPLPLYLTVGAACLILQSANAALFFSDGFNYTPGGLLGGSGSWTGSATNILVGSGPLSYANLAGLAGNSVFVGSCPSGGNTARTDFSPTPITSGNLYCSFLAQCTTLPTANSYVFSIVNTGAGPSGNADPLALYVGQQTAGSTFKIGVRHTGIGTGATYTSGAWAALSTVNLFVVEYSFGSGGTVSLFVNPTPGGSQPTADVVVTGGGTEATGLQVIGFKGNTSTSPGTWIFDSIRVGDTWGDVTPSAIPEPSGLALAGLAAVLFAWRRKRC